MALFTSLERIKSFRFDLKLQGKLEDIRVKDLAD